MSRRSRHRKILTKRSRASSNPRRVRTRSGRKRVVRRGTASQRYRSADALISLDDLASFSALDTTEIRGKDGGFICRNGSVLFAGKWRPGHSACFLNSVIGMLSFMKILDANGIIRLVTDERIANSWLKMCKTLYDNGAPEQSMQAFSIFLICCAHLKVDTYLLSSTDMGYDTETEQFVHKINSDGPVTIPAILSTTHGTVVVCVHPIETYETTLSWRFVGMFVEFHGKKLRHSVVVRAHLKDNGSYTYELFDSDDNEPKEFNNEEEIFAYILTYLQGDATPFVDIKYVYTKNLEFGIFIPTGK